MERVSTLHGRAAFGCVTAAFLVTMIATTAPTPMYAVYQERFGFSLAMVTVIFASYAVGVLAALLIAGPWSDVLGRRPMLVAGLALAGVSDVIFLLSGNIGMLLAGRVVSGLSAGIYVGTATAAVIESAPPSWRSRAPLVATAANIGGLGLGPVLAAVLMTIGPWPVHLTFWLHLAAVAVLIPLVLRLPADGSGGRLRLQRPSVPSGVRSTFTAASIVGFAGFAASGVLMAVSPRFVTRAAEGAGSLLTVSVVVTFMLASVLGQILLARMNLNPAVNLGCVLLAVGMALFAVALLQDSLPLMTIGAAIGGVGQGLSFSKGLASVLARTDAADRAAVTSAFFIVAYIAISLPVIGEGVAAQHWGLVPAGVGFTVGVGVLAVLALGALLLDQRRPDTA